MFDAWNIKTSKRGEMIVIVKDIWNQKLEIDVLRKLFQYFKNHSCISIFIRKAYISNLQSKYNVLKLDEGQEKV